MLNLPIAKILTLKKQIKVKPHITKKE